MEKVEYKVVDGKNGEELVKELNSLVDSEEEHEQWEVITITNNGGSYHQAFLRRLLNRGPMLG